MKLTIINSRKTNICSIRYKRDKVYLCARYENASAESERKWLKFCLKKLDAKKRYTLTDDRFRDFVEQNLKEMGIEYELSSDKNPTTLSENIKMYKEIYIKNRWFPFFQKVIKNCTI